MQTHDDTKRKIEKLTKINNALMARVERATDQQGNAYSLFTTAIALESQVQKRTDELSAALSSLEQTNDALVHARDAAEKANDVKTRFFTAVGHDLLQPLHAARLSLSALDESDNITEHKKLGIQIDHALQSIEDLLRSILHISKLETGAIQPSQEPVSLTEIFESLRLDFEPIIFEKGLSFNANSNDLTVYSDPLLLRRILQNLMSNAVRYTQTGGITLNATLNYADPTSIDITVGDTGPGISKEEFGYIFEEFQRGSAGSSSSARHTGFGLGLSIVQRTSNALGHHMSLNSKLGEGSRFTVSAPRSTTPAPPQTTAHNESLAKTPYNFSNFDIVILDNDHRVLEAMQTMVGPWFRATHLALSIDDIDQLLANQATRPDMILADYHLDNDTCGLTGIANLRDRWGETLPAIVITADHDQQTAQRIKSAGCEILRKPIRPAALRALISYLLNDCA